MFCHFNVGLQVELPITETLHNIAKLGRDRDTMRPAVSSPFRPPAHRRVCGDFNDGEACQGAAVRVLWRPGANQHPSLLSRIQHLLGRLLIHRLDARVP